MARKTTTIFKPVVLLPYGFNLLDQELPMGIGFGLKRAPHHLESNDVQTFYAHRFDSKRDYVERYKDEYLRKLLPALMLSLFHRYLASEEYNTEVDALLRADVACENFSKGYYDNVSKRYLMPSYEFYRTVIELDRYVSSDAFNADDYRIARTINQLMTVDQRVRHITPAGFCFDKADDPMKPIRKHRGEVIHHFSLLCATAVIVGGLAACFSGVLPIAIIGTLLAAVIVCTLTMLALACHSSIQFIKNQSAVNKLEKGTFNPPTQKPNGRFFSQSRAHRYQQQLNQADELAYDEPLLTNF